MLKPDALLPVVFLLVFLLTAGFFALTQETGDADNPDHGEPADASFYMEDGGEEGIEPEFIPLGPPRWFRSNAGGLALEEIPSRLGALSYEYALVIDYVTPDEMDPLLTPFYINGYAIEIRILYKDRAESRKQWLFRDESGSTRVNAVFSPTQDEAVPETDTALADTEPDPGVRASAGFVEVYNEKSQITGDYSLFRDGGEIFTEYFYSGGALVRAETKEKDFNAVEYRRTYTDNYRYNRSYSLRSVERVFHEASGLAPVRLVFPGRALDAAHGKDFLNDKLIITTDFLDINMAEAGFRMVYDTDSKGRALGETLYNDKNEVVWTVKNTWVGDRITAILKIEGDEEKLTEYEYDSSGNRLVQRDKRNGVLERQVLIDGAKETEELYLNGVVVLRAFWEDGRKILEERIRRR